MSNKLNNITTQYRKFSKGQYVDHKQFNEFLDSFEDQTRLSRLLLHGVGVACGFEHKLFYRSSVQSRTGAFLAQSVFLSNVARPQEAESNELRSVSNVRLPQNSQLAGIQLSQGVGVTTDGDLVTLKQAETSSKNGDGDLIQNISIENKQYTFFKEYDNSKVGYPAFYDENTSEQIPLLELATDQEIEGLNGFKSFQNIDQDYKYLILYVESYEKEEKPCRGVDCDNHGEVQVADVKLLLTTEEGIQNVLKSDSIFEDRDGDKLLKTLPEISVKRVFFDEDSLTEWTMQDKYEVIAKDTELINNIEDGFKKITDYFKTENNFEKDGFSLQNILDQGFAKHSGFQYCYDFVKELVETYNEIKDLLHDYRVLCFPDIHAFPKHLMLGGVWDETSKNEYRHAFYNAQNLDEKDISGKINFLIGRFNKQILKFYPIDTDLFLNPPPVKVIPSQHYDLLGNKAVPFYYSFDEGLLKNWNYQITKQQNWDKHLSYYSSAFGGIDISAVYDDLKEHTFYRIEGHQGGDLTSAVNQLELKKAQYQLPFDVMSLSLEELGNNQDETKAYFFDYLEKHPGMSHKAGVPAGGTFILVYNSESDKKVVADFALPYLCCGKPKKVGLILPEQICVYDDPFQMNVQPVDGVVKAFVNDTEILEIPKQGDKSIFDPGHSAFASHLGEAIQFTVNGKPIAAEITVLDQPDVNITIDEVVMPDSNTVEVSFKVVNNDGANYTYSWDFLGTNNYVQEVPDSGGIVKHTYAKHLNPKPVVKVKIEREEGCARTVEFSDWYDVFYLHSVTISNPYCCNRNEMNITSVGFSGESDCCNPK